MRNGTKKILIIIPQQFDLSCCQKESFVSVFLSCKSRWLLTSNTWSFVLTVRWAKLMKEKISDSQLESVDGPHRNLEESNMPQDFLKEF